MAVTKPAEKIEEVPEVDMETDELPEGFEEIPSPQPLEDINVISVKREDTRGRLAIFFLLGFFVIIIIGMIIAAINEGDKVNSMKETLLVISGILSGPLGFVIGYYFRSREED
jgi:hypothetical protein